MIERNGSIWETDAKIIGHGVNTQGLMGAGIAVQFKDKFPDNYHFYRDQCTAGHLKPGDFAGYLENEKIIMNFASQRNPGKDARYDWLFNSLFAGAAMWSNASEDLKGKYGTVIAIPEIGCGIGGLKWRA